MKQIAGKWVTAELAGKLGDGGRFKVFKGTPGYYIAKLQGNWVGIPIDLPKPELTEILCNFQGFITQDSENVWILDLEKVIVTVSG